MARKDRGQRTPATARGRKTTRSTSAQRTPDPTATAGGPVQGLGRGGSAAQAAPPATPYDQLTVYDPATHAAVRADGTVATPPTLAELAEMPGALAVLDRLYECEDADEKHVRMLAQLAESTVAAIETKRLDWRPTPQYCAPTVRLNRRRCWRCPRWTETTDTPF